MRDAIRQNRNLFAAEDEDELTNECVLHWLTVGGAYQEGRGANEQTFLNTAIENYLRDLRRRRSLRAKRTLSLDRPLRRGSELTIADMAQIPAREIDEDHVASERKRGVSRAIAVLGGREHEIALGLLAGHSVMDISRALGISRPACYRSIKRIARVFEDHELREFLR